MQLLSGRVAVVVGADHVAGRAAAAFFARAGAAVVLAGRDAGVLEGTARELVDLGSTAMAVTLDPADGGEAGGLIARVLERFGQLDVVVLFGHTEEILAAVGPVLAERGRGQVVLVAPPDPDADAPAGAERAAPISAAVRRLAADGRRRGVVVSLIRPGLLAGELGLPPDQGRLRPEDLAQAVLSLAAFAPGVRPAELVLVPLDAPAGGGDAAGPEPFPV